MSTHTETTQIERNKYILININKKIIWNNIHKQRNLACGYDQNPIMSQCHICEWGSLHIYMVHILAYKFYANIK